MNIDNSISSEMEAKSPEKVSQLLCSEIEDCGFNGWSNHSIDLSVESDK